MEQLKNKIKDCLIKHMLHFILKGVIKSPVCIYLSWGRFTVALLDILVFTFHLITLILAMQISTDRHYYYLEYITTPYTLLDFRLLTVYFPEWKLLKEVGHPLNNNNKNNNTFNLYRAFHS